MIPILPTTRLIGASCLALAMLAAPAAVLGAPQGASAHALLDVPYLTQTPELCGGAAVSMVLRYWGERNVFPQDFASLLVAGDDGIVTTALAGAVVSRGWQALLWTDTAVSARARLRADLDLGRPLIALIEVAPRSFHYVVVVGSTDRDVVVHDPARAPFRQFSWADFDRAWAASSRWTMLVLPPAGFRSP